MHTIRGINSLSSDYAQQIFDGSGNLLMGVRNEGRVGIKTNAPLAPLHVSADNINVSPLLINDDTVIVSSENNYATMTQITASGASHHRPIIKGVRTDGTLLSPAKPSNSDYVMSLLSCLYDGNAVQATAAIDFFVDGPVSQNIAPQRISFVTSETSGSARVERLVVKSTGDVGIGTTIPQSKLDVNGGIKCGNDTDTASADKVGTTRYWADANNSYVDVCVQTEVSTYAWRTINQETW